MALCRKYERIPSSMGIGRTNAATAAGGHLRRRNNPQNCIEPFASHHVHASRVETRTFIVDGIDDMLRTERRLARPLRPPPTEVDAVVRTWRDAADIMVVVVDGL